MTVARAPIPQNTNGVKESCVQLPGFFGHIPTVFDSHVSNRQMEVGGDVRNLH